MQLQETNKIIITFREADFYLGGHAARLCEAGAACPLPLLVERGEGNRDLTLCMTRLDGSTDRCMDDARTCAVLTWLARLHALYWGRARADAAVAEGLQPQGCFWHLDARRLELERTSREGADGRLRLAAAGIDARLKADRSNRNPRPQPQTSSTLMSLTEFSEYCLYYKLVIWGSSWSRGFRFHSLKADAMQTICHGDPKDANILCYQFIV